VYAQLSEPLRSCCCDCVVELPSVPDAKARDEMPRLVLRGAMPSSELPNGVPKRAGAAGLCDMRWRRFAVFSPTPSLLPVAAAERLLAELSTAR
jgi:hypothetical protein